MTKQQLLEQLNSNITEFAFIPVTKVIELVNNLEESQATPQATPTNVDRDEILNTIREIVSDCLNDITWSEYMNFDDAEVSLNYKEITVDDVPFDGRSLHSYFMRNFNDGIRLEITNKED